TLIGRRYARARDREPRDGGLHPGVERGGEPPVGARRAPRGAAGSGRARDRRRVDGPYGGGGAGGPRERRLVRVQPRPAGRDRGGVPRGGRAWVRVLRTRRRRRPAPGGRAEAPARPRAVGIVRRRGRLAVRRRRRLPGLSLRAEPGAPVRHRTVTP